VIATPRGLVLWRHGGLARRMNRKLAARMARLPAALVQPCSIKKGCAISCSAQTWASGGRIACCRRGADASYKSHRRRSGRRKILLLPPARCTAQRDSKDSGVHQRRRGDMVPLSASSLSPLCCWRLPAHCAAALALHRRKIATWCPCGAARDSGDSGKIADRRR